MAERALVHGLAVAGSATARALVRHGYDVVVSDDRLDAAMAARAVEIGAEPVALPDDLASFVAGFDVVAPAPGVPETHLLVLAAQQVGIELCSEIELAYRWEQQRGVEAGGPRPMLAITGTDGKTTTTELAVAILRSAGLAAEAVGNTDTPLVDVVDRDPPLDAYVVECTSFRLAWTRHFRAEAAAWLNLAPDHLNWHASMETYEAAKARIWQLQRPGDVAIGFVDDPAVMNQLTLAPGRHVTFGTVRADYRVETRRGRAWLCGPVGPIAEVAAMRRSLPHDVTNALAASALVLESGLAGTDAIATALAEFSAPPHRLELVATIDGVGWYNDSKATTPHAAATAIRAFDSLVLIAGGSRKGVDLSPMAAHAEGVRAVVAIGEAGPDVGAVFAGRCPVVEATSMAEAVLLAGDSARPGDAVVLSPGCASFDWYTGYPARGDDFRRLVVARRDGGTADETAEQAADSAADSRAERRVPTA